MSDNPYSERLWLNAPGHPSTGSIVAYDGPANWDGVARSTFFEVGDCHSKARIHKGDKDTVAEFAAKVRAISAAAARFADHLEAATKAAEAEGRVLDADALASIGGGQ